MDLLFELIQVALGQRNRLSRNPSDEDWQRLFQMAEEQAITSFLFPALEILNKCGQKPPVELLLEWIGVRRMLDYIIVTQNRWSSESRTMSHMSYAESRQRKTIVKSQKAQKE